MCKARCVEAESYNFDCEKSKWEGNRHVLANWAIITQTD